MEKKVYDPKLQGYDARQRLADGLGVRPEELTFGFVRGKYGTAQVQQAIASLRKEEQNEVAAFVRVMQLGGAHLGR